LLFFADSSARGDLKVAVSQQGLVDESSRCRPKKITLFSARTPEQLRPKTKNRSKYLN